MTEACDGREVAGMDLHRRRSVLVRMAPDGRKLETARITNSPAELRRAIAGAGPHPRVVLEATYGWYWAADTLAAAGAEVHLAHPLGVKGFAYRRVKNDVRDAADLADLLRMGRLPEAWIVCRSKIGFCVVSCVFIGVQAVRMYSLIRPLRTGFRRIWRAWKSPAVMQRG